MRTLLIWMLALGVAAPSSALAQASKPAVSGSIAYTIAKGDNLYTLAARFLARTSHYSIVQRVNNISDPYRLKVGSRIAIPRKLLRKEPIRAVVQSYRGAVQIVRGDLRRSVSLGMPLMEGDVIETGHNSFLTLYLPDESRVALPSRSAIRIQRLRRTLLAGSVERLFTILNGRARAVVAPMADPESDFRFSTPVAVSAVRGTEFRMRYSAESRRATTEVLEGVVAFDASATKAAPIAADATPQAVRAGYGTASDFAQPLALLPAPELLAPARIQDEEQLQFTLKPLDGAVRYRVEIAADAGFIDVLNEAEAASTDATLPALPDGSYFVRVTGIDRSGLEGMPATYGFERRLNRVEASVESGRAGGYRQYLFRWRTLDTDNAQYRFQLALNRDGSEPIVDELGLGGTSFVVTDLPPGVFYWRVQTVEVENGRVYQKWSPIQELRIELEE